MLKLDKETMDQMGKQHPGILESIRQYEEDKLPTCTQCGAEDTASVSTGVVGRTIYLAAATTKIKLVPNEPKRGKYFCNKCENFFS